MVMGGISNTRAAQAPRLTEYGDGMLRCLEGSDVCIQQGIDGTGVKAREVHQGCAKRPCEWEWTWTRTWGGGY